ncbi:MAG: ATP-binding protein [Syntrophomonas sp.]
MNIKNDGKVVASLIIFALILCLAAVLTYGVKSNSNNKIPKVQNGVLDLTKWNIKTDGSVALDGQWEFYWGKFLTDGDFEKSEARKQRMLVNVPNTWNHYKNGNQRFPGHGYATYRMRIIKGDNQLDGLKVMTTLTASNLFINGKNYLASGVVGTDADSSKPAKNPALVRFNDNSRELEIILHVSNFTDARGGLWEETRVGTYASLERDDRRQLALDAFMAGGLFLIAIYYLSIFLFRGDSKESLYFSIGCVLILLKLMVSDSYFIFRLFPGFLYQLSCFLYYLSLYWGVFMFLVFILSLYPIKGSKIPVRVYFVTASAFTVFSLVAPGYATTITPFYDVINLAAQACIVLIIMRAAYKDLFGARIIMWGTLVMALVVLHDILKFTNIIRSPFDALIAAGGMFFVMVLSLVLAARFASEYRQLQVFAGKLESMDRLKDEFLANTSHELRTPVNAMIAISESIVKDKAAELGKKEKDDLLHVVSSGRRLISLINDILDYSRLKHGDLTLQKKVFSMDSLVQGVVREFSYIAAGKNIDIAFAPETNQLLVYADEYRITQVLYNIIGNAVKFTNNGGKITVSEFSDRDTVYLSVSDNGIGIPEEKMSDIFETFQQGDASITRKYGGMGLGLSISRKIINAHGREIQVVSRPGGGSEFIFGVPVEKPDAYHDTNLPEISYSYLKDTFVESNDVLAAAGTRKGIIVLVDDNYANLIGAVNILRADNYTVKGFTDPYEALREIFEGTDTAAAVIDVMMPEMSGYELCTKIRERFSLFELPVLLLTANTTTERIIEGFESGSNDFLKKPFDGEELRARVTTLYNLKYATEKAINNETAFLQAQIKPHFLYNTINTIISYCHTDPSLAANMLLDLSHYLRHLFDFESEERLIPLSREMDAVKAYLSLEKARFMGDLEYRIDYDDNINTMIPPMIIQPLVENAVRHGLRKVEWQGSIVIKGERTEGFYIIVIEDNGAGIGGNDFEKILRGERNDGTGTGLSNVRKRLRYFYGTDIEIESIPGRGTRVTVKVKAG